MNEIEKQIIAGYNLTTAEIIYHMPDTPHLLQSYIWQDFDIAPQFPELMLFLTFWERELDGPLHSVILEDKKLITAQDLVYYNGEVLLH